MAGFVIVYNRRTGAADVTEFPAADGHRAALQYRLKLEVEREDADVEIVSLASDSIETVRSTHSRYFKRDLAQL
ncbi:hypothetical protein [Cellulomonas sp. URHB0016]